MNSRRPSDIIFSPAAKAAQQQRGSREAYARMDEEGQVPETVTDDLANFIAARDSFYFGTASCQGQPYIQHRGGPKGFIKVLDEKTLAFGDLVGNSQYITVGNLDENDQAIMFLMDYPNRRRIKIWGKAEYIEGDESLLEKVTVDERPERVVVFHVTAWNANCPKNIWQRWTADEANDRMSLLATQLEDAKRENRLLKRQLSKYTNNNPKLFT